MEGCNPVVNIWIHTLEKLASREGELCSFPFTDNNFIFGQCSKYQNCWLSYNFDRDDSDYRKTLSVRFKIGVRQKEREVIHVWTCFVQSWKYFVFICLTCTLHRYVWEKCYYLYSSGNTTFICIFTPFLSIFKIEYFIKNKGSWIRLLLWEPRGRDEKRKILL